MTKSLLKCMSISKCWSFHVMGKSNKGNYNIWKTERGVMWFCRPLNEVWHLLSLSSFSLVRPWVPQNFIPSLPHQLNPHTLTLPSSGVPPTFHILTFVLIILIYKWRERRERRERREFGGLGSPPSYPHASTRCMSTTSGFEPVDVACVPAWVLEDGTHGLITLSVSSIHISFI